MMDEQLKELLKKAFDEGAMYEATFSKAYSFDSFIEDNIEQLRLYGVVGRSEQLTCPRCNSTNILSPDKDNDAQCIECAFIWDG